MITRRQRTRVKRGDRAVRNKAAFWNQKYTAAKTPQGKADVAWDHVRAGVLALAPERRDEAWKQVRDHLTVLLDGPLAAGSESPTTVGRAHGGRQAQMEDKWTG